MPLTLLDCADHIEHTLSGPLSMPSVLELANQAGEHLVGMHQWMFLRRPPVRLATRASITLTGSTWTESSLALVEASAYASYTFLQGDEVEITAGTGANLGHYKLASKANNNGVVLETSIGSAADGNSDITGTLTLWGVALPSDFGNILELTSGDGLQNYVQLTTMDEIARLRSDTVSTSGTLYRAAISYGQALAGGAPVPRLELWPQPPSADPNGILLNYRAGWVEPTSDSVQFNLPRYVESLYIALLRAFARGYEEEDEGTLSQRLAEIEFGAVMAGAKRRDGGVQRSYGAMSGGWRGVRSGASITDRDYPLGGPS